jgi:hypothetical protein
MAKKDSRNKNCVHAEEANKLFIVISFNKAAKIVKSSLLIQEALM